MWQVFAGTVLLASLLAGAGLWALLSAVRQLEDGETEPIDVRAGGASRPVAAHVLRRTDAGDLSAMLTGIGRRRTALRAGTTAYPRGPARLSGRAVPSTDTAA
jgi:hypothetical protein